MNEAIELHDSELAAVSFSGGKVVVSLSPAYIHRAGSGWLQRATLTFGGASPVAPSTLLPVTISDGSLRIGSVIHSNVIPASGSFEGVIEFSILLSTAEELTIRGQRINIQLHDEPTFVESINL